MTDMAQHARFHLVYDGPALVQHQMDVRALAPALLAMGDLVERANELLNGSQAKVSVNVHASFKSGSFGIDLELAQSLWQRALDFANSNPVTGILSIVGLLGIGKSTCTGLVQAIVWLRGRGVKHIDPIGDGVVRLYVDEEHLDIEERVLQLLQDYRVRRALEGVIADPLGKERLTKDGLKADYEVMEVLEHRSASPKVQLRMNFGGSDEHSP